MKKNPYAKLLILSLILYVSCTPSKKFLLQKNLKNNIDKNYVRILLFKTGEGVKISSNSRLRISEKKTGKTLFDSIKVRISIYPDKIKKPIYIESWGSPLYVNNKPFRGMLEINNVIGKLYVINILKIDEYLYSVVPGEIPASWNIEALKAQAVAARTYAYFQLLKNRKKLLYDLDSTTSFQLYKGISVEKPVTTEAVKETSGVVILNKYEPIVAYFHSTCGGRTIDDKHVWGTEDKKYLTGVSCRYCRNSPEYSWKTKLSLYEMKQYLRKKNKRIGIIKKILFKKKSGRVIEVTIHHKYGVINISGNQFRLLFPKKRIKSMYFNSIKTPDGIVLLGHGWGHGVGMCQWGAKGMAESGANYRAILKYYYKGITILRINKRHIAQVKAHSAIE